MLRVESLPLGPVAVGARTFVRRGERRLVAIVKATCAIVPDGPMQLLGPTPLVERDMALRMPLTQIIVGGLSHAPPGSSGVRLFVGRGETILIDKQVAAPAGLPAGLGPVLADAPARRQRLGSAARALIEGAFDLVLPDDFEDGYFVAAPPDQCVAETLVGGEMIALVHLHPQLPTIRTYLPPCPPPALLQTDRGARLSIKLKLDTVILLPEALRAELVWRGDARVDDEALRAARLFGGWGDADSAGAFSPAAALAPAAPAPRPREGTMILEAPAPRTTEAAKRGRAGTMLIETGPSAPPAEDDDVGPSTTVMRTPSPAAAPQPGSDSLSTRSMLDEPTSDAAEVPPPRSMPFRGRRPSARPGADPSGPRAALPGAPWSVAVRAANPPRVRADGGATMVLGLPEEPIAPRLPVVETDTTAASSPPPPAPREPPPRAETPVPDPGTPWRGDPPEGPVEHPSSVVRPARQRVSFRSDLYKKLKK